MITRNFTFKQTGDLTYVDREVGAGWELYDNDNIESWYDVDPQFYQVLNNAIDYEMMLWDGGITITAELEVT
jgi:hypothetical protein